MRTRVAVLAGAGLLLWLIESSNAYSLIGRRWASGASIVMHLQLGSSSGALIDGSTSWNTPTENSLAIWNPFLNTVSFRVTRDSTASASSGNGINNVIWGDDIYGEPFGSETLAVTVGWYRLSDNTYTERDVIFNRAFSWNSYRGNLRNASGGGRLQDIRRVAIHEFGHVIGLDHPDEHGQSVTAIMNSRVSNLDTVQTDDTSGARAIYGASPSTPSNRSPTVTMGCTPCTIGAGETSTLRATATDPDGDSLTYQWSAPQGSFASTTAASTVWTAPVHAGSVTATVIVQDGRGGNTTGTIAVQVVFRDRLLTGARLVSGQSITSGNSRFRLLYQPDGNLVLYDDVARTAPWNSGTVGTTAGQAIMQSDGNFVIYDSQGRDRFTTGTTGNAGAFLVVQNDGNIVVYRSNGTPVWDRFSVSTTNNGT